MPFFLHLLFYLYMSFIGISVIKGSWEPCLRRLIFHYFAQLFSRRISDLYNRQEIPFLAMWTRRPSHYLTLWQKNRKKNLHWKYRLPTIILHTLYRYRYTYFYSIFNITAVAKRIFNNTLWALNLGGMDILAFKYESRTINFMID